MELLDGETTRSSTTDCQYNTDKLINNLVDEAVAFGKIVATRELLTPRGGI